MRTEADGSWAAGELPEGVYSVRAEAEGFVTATQLAAWLAPRVTRDSGGLQHPQYSALDGEGDFVFVLPAAPR